MSVRSWPVRILDRARYRVVLVAYVVLVGVAGALARPTGGRSLGLLMLSGLGAIVYAARLLRRGTPRSESHSAGVFGGRAEDFELGNAISAAVAGLFMAGAGFGFASGLLSLN